MTKNKLYILILLLIPLLGISQQDPQYTQYMYNMSVVNPAYTTNDTGIINFGSLYRLQWNSVVGAPKTLTFFAHAALSKKVEAGISFISDEIGDGAAKENNIYADFAYNLKLDEKSDIALGLKAGITNFNTNFDGFRFPEYQDDVAFNENLNTTFPNIGIGAFYHRDKFYTGISIPNLLNSKHISNNNGISTFGAEEIHLFLIAGYVYNLNSNIKIKPSSLIKVVNNAPLTFDFAVNALFNEKFEAGLAYRLDDSISAMFNISILNGVRAGYAYDYTLSNLGEFSSGSHEIFILFNLDLLGLKKGYDKSPRFY